MMIRDGRTNPIKAPRCKHLLLDTEHRCTNCGTVVLGPTDAHQRAATVGGAPMGSFTQATLQDYVRKSGDRTLAVKPKSGNKYRWNNSTLMTGPKT